MNIENIRKELVQNAKDKIRKYYSSKDMHIIKAVNFVEVIDEVFNKTCEHAIEWYSMHFSELYSIVSDNRTFLDCVLLGRRKDYSKEKLSSFIKDEKKIENILRLCENSMGSKIEDDALIEIQKIAKSAVELNESRKTIVEFIEKNLGIIAPNFSELATPTIGAKLLAQAGSLEKLVFLPSSTIQVLGAEKALFRHLRSNAKPPKHGYLYQHTLVTNLKPAWKGRMARTLAGKLVIALKEDFYGNENIVNELKEKLEKRREQILKSDKK